MGELFDILKINLIDSVGARTKRRSVMGMVDVKNQVGDRVSMKR